jgi:hypothetical protein
MTKGTKRAFSSDFSGACYSLFIANEGVQNASLRLAGSRRPLVLSVGTNLLRVSRRWRANSFASGFCAHIVYDLRIHWKKGLEW